MKKTLKDAVLVAKVKKFGKEAVILDLIARDAKERAREPTFEERHDSMVGQIPAWQDEATQINEKARLSAHLQSQGWTEQELNDITPGRAVAEYNRWKTDERQQIVDDATAQAEAEVRRECHGGAPPEKVGAALLRNLGLA